MAKISGKYNYRPIVLVILDGWGEWNTKMGNPVSVAKLPTIDSLNKYYPKLLIEASGLAVGLPWGVFGNSEVGHQTIGSGQIIYHNLPTITGSIQSRSFFSNKTLVQAFSEAKKKNTQVHLLGLVSDGGVHSHINHLFALIKMAKEKEIDKLFIHAITDGRDTPTDKAVKFLGDLNKYLNEVGVGKVATVVGRYYAMDRNNNWERIEKAFSAYTMGLGQKEKNPVEGIQKQYLSKIYDEFLEPMIIVDDNEEPIGLIKEGDVIINFNFRADRARQITRAFVMPDFDKFKKEVQRPADIYYVAFTEYEEEVPTPAVFPPQKITSRIGQILAEKNKKQLRIAETEKFAHVTYFFNGGVPEPFPGEERIFVPSKNVKSYAEVPEMSAYEVTEKLLNAINSNKYDFILVNYANSDMVGHTGVFPAAVKTLEVVDSCLERLITTVFSVGGCLIITADHGNIEEMINLETGEIDTQHSTNPVPLWFVAPNNKKKEPMSETPTEIQGMLSDIAGTVLELFDIKIPDEMVGQSLLDRLL